MVLLKASDPVLTSSHARHSPFAYKSFRITLIRFVFSIRLYKRRNNLRIILHGRYQPRLGTVSEEAFREKEDRSHVLKGNFCGIESSIKTSSRRMRSHYDQRTLSIAAIKRLIKVSLFSFGRDTCRRTCTLNVNDHQRQLSHHGKSKGLALE